MFSYISNNLIDVLIKNNKIDDCERDIYFYCIKATIEMLFNIIITLIIGIIWCKPIETVIFLCLIIPLRSTSGGCHAEKSITCFFLSIGIYLLTIEISSILTLSSSKASIIYIILMTLVGLLTPVDSIHKRLEKQEKDKQRKNFRVLIFIVSLIFIILILLKCTKYSNIVLSVLFVIFILQITGIIKNKLIYHLGTQSDHS